MGLILDSSVLIRAERKARPVSELLLAIRDTTGLTEILLSAVSQKKWDNLLLELTPRLASAGWSFPSRTCK